MQLHPAKNKILKDIKNLNIDYPKWKEKINEANSIEDIDKTHNAIIIVAKKKFLVLMLSTLKAPDNGLKEKISACNEITCLDSPAKTYSVIYYKFNLIRKAILVRVNKETELAKSL